MEIKKEMKELRRKVYKQARVLYDRLYEIVDDMPSKFIDTQNLGRDKDPIYGYAFNGESYVEMRVLALGIFDNTLCAYMEQEMSSCKVVYKKEELLDEDEWMTLDPRSEVAYLSTLDNITDVIDQYVLTDKDRLIRKVNEFAQLEYGGGTPNVEEKDGKIPIAYTTDYAYIDDEEILYEVQTYYDTEKGAFDTYVDGTLVESRKATYEEAISELDTAEFTDYVEGYTWDGDDTLDCVIDAIRKELGR